MLRYWYIAENLKQKNRTAIERVFGKEFMIILIRLNYEDREKERE